MSYEPRHGGGQNKTAKSAEPAGKRSVEPSTPKNKKLMRILVIALLVLFAAGIVVALIFMLKPAVAPADGAATEAYPTERATTVASSEYIGSYTSSSPVLQYSNGEIPTSGERHDVTVAAGGGPDAMEIIGTWYVDKWTAYVFDGYGRGVMLTSNDNYTFAYSAQNGHLMIDYDNDKGMDTEYDYILNGEKLTLKRGNSEYKLTREPEPKQTQEATQEATQGSTQVQTPGQGQ